MFRIKFITLQRVNSDFRTALYDCMRIIIVKILNVLAKKILAKYKPVVIGIAGNVGKSSTKKAIYGILKRKYKIACNDSSYKADISISLAIIGLENGGKSVKKWAGIIIKALGAIIRKTKYPDILIIEMGVDKPNDIKKMLKVIKPDIGILTDIEKFPSHTKYFKDAGHIAREKALLIKSLGKKDLAILNSDDKFIKVLLESVKSKVVTYGFGLNSDVKAEEIFLGDKKRKIGDGSVGMSFKISYRGTTVPFRLPYVLNRGQIYATLSAVALGIHFGFNLVEMSEILSSYQPLVGRMKSIKEIKNL